MDSNIRLLLSSVQQYGVIHGINSALHQAYELLKRVTESRLNADGPEAFGQDLYVICAEIAFQNGYPDMTKDCLRMYFMKTPPPNQFLCRAYLSQSQLLAPTSAENPSQLEKAVVYLLKAISFAKENIRYHFLVYNASVLYWQFCRPFLKPNYRQYLSISLHQVVKALDDIDDKDYEWRAQLMIALIECHVDAGRMKEASEVSKATAEFTKSNVSSLYKQVLKLQVRHQLIDLGKLAKDIRINADLVAYYKVCKVKGLLEQKDGSDVHAELEKVLKYILRDEPASRSSSAMSLHSGGRRTVTPAPVVPTAPVSQDESDRRSSVGSNVPSEASDANVPSEGSDVNVPSEASDINVPSEASDANVPSEALDVSVPSEASDTSHNSPRSPRSEASVEPHCTTPLSNQSQASKKKKVPTATLR